MPSISEAQAMKQLGIDSWRNLSKDRFLNYIAMIPDVSEDLRLKILEQLPEIMSFTKDFVQTIITEQRDITNKNQETTKSIILSLKPIQSSLDHLCKQPDLTFEERKYFCDKQLEIAQIYLKLDENNKKFLSDIWKGVVSFGIGILGFVAIILGGKFLFGSKDDQDKDDQENDHVVE